MNTIHIAIAVMATVATALVILGISKSQSYDHLVENLDRSTHPLKDLYGLGFFLASTPVFALRDNRSRELRRQSKLYWNNIYYVYYAELAWAEFLTIAILVAAVGFSLAAMMSGATAIFVVFGAALGIAAAYSMVVSSMSDAVKQRREECEYEFPDMVVKFALLVSSGMVTRLAWRTVAYSKEGAIYDLMQQACNDMDNGMTETEAIHNLGVLSDSEMIKKFSSSLTQSMEKGGSDLAAFLLAQTAELLAHKRQVALQAGEVAATKLIIPVALMFVGVIIIIAAAAGQSMMSSF